MNIDVKSPGFIIGFTILILMIIVIIINFLNIDLSIQAESEHKMEEIDSRINNNELIYIDIVDEEDNLVCRCFFQELMKNDCNLDDDQNQKSDAIIYLEKINITYNCTAGTELITNASFSLVSVFHFNEVKEVYKKEYYYTSGELLAKWNAYGLSESTKYYDLDGNFVNEVIVPIAPPTTGYISGMV